MKKSYIWIGVILILVLMGVSSYNGMVRENNKVEKAWGNVENNYQRRLDLIPNLVSVVKKYAEYEQSTFVKVTEARSGVQKLNIDPSKLDAETLQKYQQAQAAVGQSLRGAINVVLERYPELKANQNFLSLQDQLEGTENRINTARKDFNSAAESYNNKVQRFPAVIFARIFGFDTRPYFKSEEGAEKAPNVNELMN